MDWLQRMAMRRAAKRYGKRLPRMMAEGWGGSEFYTVGQIRSALGRLKISGPYDAIAYAAFLPEEEFAAHTAELPVPLPYEEARTLFERYCPRAPNSTYWFDASSRVNIAQSGFGQI